MIVCCVDLGNEKIYWKQITATEAFQSNGKSKKVTFCLEKDELNIDTAASFRLLVCPTEYKELPKLFDELRVAFRLVPNIDDDYCDIDAFVAVDEKRDAVVSVLVRLEPLLAHFPWRISAGTHQEYRERYRL